MGRKMYHERAMRELVCVRVCHCMFSLPSVCVCSVSGARTAIAIVTFNTRRSYVAHFLQISTHAERVKRWRFPLKPCMGWGPTHWTMLQSVASMLPKVDPGAYRIPVPSTHIRIFIPYMHTDIHT